jgi:hypothetical protein
MLKEDNIDEQFFHLVNIQRNTKENNFCFCNLTELWFGVISVVGGNL